MPNYQKHIVYLSDEQREELFTNGTITVNGQTITYSDNDMYVTPQETPYVKPATGIPASDLAEGVIPGVPVQDVRVNGTSILQNGVANVPVAGTNELGAVKINSSYGIKTNVDGVLQIQGASIDGVKPGTNEFYPITPANQHESIFYGLAKAAGHDEKNSTEPLGTYTPEAKSAIRSMIGAADADEVNNKANRDGYYSEMTVGNAEQLVSSKFVEDQEPYTLRASGGSADIGNRENLTAIVGGTLAWNQQVRDEASENVTEFADIVTVDDAVADAAAVKVKIEPVQDLHGYDHPWPAGGGKNLFDASSATFKKWQLLSNAFKTRNDTYSNIAFSVDGDTVTVTTQGTYLGIGFELSASASVRTASISGSASNIAFYSAYEDGATLLSNGAMSCSIPSDTAGFVGVRFDTAGTYTLKLQLESGSTATAWTPYSNICPITGFNKVEVWDDPNHGGNIEWNQQFANGNFESADRWRAAKGTLTVADNIATVTANSTATTNVELFEYPVAHKVVGHKYLYTLEFNPSISLGRVSIQGMAVAGVYGIFPANVWSKTGIIFTSTADSLIDIYFFSESAFAEGNTVQIKNCMLFDLTQMFGAGNEPSTVEEFQALFPTDYYPYNAGEVTTVSAVNGDPYQHYTVTIPSEAGTVYGGSLTVNKDGTGTLVADKASFVLDGDTSKFQVPAAWYGDDTERESIGFYWYFNYTGFNSLPKPKTYSSYADVVGNLSSDKLLLRQFGVYNVDIWYTFGIPTNANYFAIRLPKKALSDVSTELASKESCMEWLRNNPVQFCYKIKEPQTYTLTASQVQTLLGTNNVWSDAGQVSLTYTGTNEHLTLTDRRKYMTRINGVDSMVLGAGQALTAVKGRDNVFDLTQMFGTAAVADYVYGQGAGYFRKWFPAGRYAYNPGELKSVEGLQSHDTVGFNLWDEEWEVGAYDSSTGEKTVNGSWWRSKNAIRVIPETVYCAKAQMDIMCICFYDAAMNFILQRTIYTRSAYTTFTVPSDAYYLTFYIWKSAPKEVCINLSNSGSRNGEYESYEKHGYPLDSSVILRGVPKLIDGKPGWDGDRYLPDGTVEKRYGVADLSTIPVWNSDAVSSSGYVRFVTPSAYLTDKKEGYNLISNKLITSDTVVPSTPNAEMISGYSGGKSVYVSIFASKLSGDLSTANGRSTAFVNYLANNEITIVYELATPTTETATPYRELQQVDDWGTEEFVATGLVPVGHETQYPTNLRDKLQHLPDLASSNGIYIVKQTDSEMELMKLPDMPMANGNYRLKLNVASGSPTFSWEVVT